MKKRRQILKGEVYYTDLDPIVGSEQGGIRPVLVVQNDTSNRYSPTVIVLPITSREKAAQPSHIDLAGTCGLSKHSIALAEQIRTVDKSRLGARIGIANNAKMKEADRALMRALGLSSSTATDPQSIRTLCQDCKQDYESAGFSLRRTGSRRDAKGKCDYCNSSMGFDFEVVEL